MRFRRFRPCCTSAISTPASRSAMSRRSGRRGPTYRSTSIRAGTGSTATRVPTMSRRRRRSRSDARSSFFANTSGSAFLVLIQHRPAIAGLSRQSILFAKNKDRPAGDGVDSILALRLQAEHVLPVHAAGGIPIEADVGGSCVRVAPASLQRFVQKESLPAGGEEQRIDRLHQKPNAIGLVAPVAQ